MVNKCAFLSMVVLNITVLMMSFSLNAQTKDTIHLNPTGGSLSSWCGGTFIVNHHHYYVSIADGNNDHKITFDSSDYINFNADGRHQKVAAVLNSNPTVFKDALTGTCISIKVLDEAGKVVQYNEVACNTNITGTLINSIPTIKVKHFFTDKYVLFDSISRLNAGQNMLLVHFMRLTDYTEDTSELRYYVELAKQPIKIILFMKAGTDKMDVRALLHKYHIAADVYEGGNDDVSDAFNVGILPGSVLFVNGKPIYFEMFGMLDEVLGYIIAHPEFSR